MFCALAAIRCLCCWRMKLPWQSGGACACNCSKQCGEMNVHLLNAALAFFAAALPGRLPIVACVMCCLGFCSCCSCLALDEVPFGRDATQRTRWLGLGTRLEPQFVRLAERGVAPWGEAWRESHDIFSSPSLPRGQNSPRVSQPQPGTG